MFRGGSARRRRHHAMKTTPQAARSSREPSVTNASCGNTRGEPETGRHTSVRRAVVGRSGLENEPWETSSEAFQSDVQLDQADWPGTCRGAPIIRTTGFNPSRLETPYR
jgi:hypothetical protein